MRAHPFLVVLTCVLALALGSCNTGKGVSNGSTHGTLRVLNVIPNAGGPLNVTFDLKPFMTDLPFEGMTQYQTIDAGSREVQVSVAGSSTNLIDVTPIFLPDVAYTFVAFGALANATGIILNESAARQLGWRDAVGKDLYALDNFPKPDLTRLHVVGVIKDFNFNSLRDQVTPLAIRWRRQNNRIAARISTRNTAGVISQIESKWKVMAPGQPFHYSFMNEDFDNLYRTEQETGKLCITFAVLAIFIACLGLLGLAMFTAEQRTREIGIRKVLGASVSGILSLLTMDFLKLVFIAILVASPLAWWVMHMWLQDFAYRTSISWTVFAMATAAALLTALGTISLQALKAALANPVKSLRTE